MESFVTWDQLIQLGILLIAAATFLYAVLHNNKRK